MSDFISNFWHLYVAGITLVSIIACLLLLWFSGKAKAMTANDNTTGHVWDGDLREMNNPLPRWWVGLFIITIIFAFVYLAMYPGAGSFAGKFGWSSAGQYEAEVAKGNAEVAPLYAKFQGMPPEQVSKDPQAMAIGDRLFMNNCAQCHGSDARGSKGFPSLADTDWLYGGTPEDVRNVAHYVLSLSGSPHDSLRASLGKPKFGACAACHGMDGKGNHAMGAPNLTDDIWLHGWGENAIVNIINNGKLNQMPAQAAKLTEGQIHVLASYVWGLSNNAVPKASVSTK